MREAIEARIEHLTQGGLARRQGQRVIFARDLLDTLGRRELEETAEQLASQTGLSHRPLAEGDSAAGIYRRRVNLTSGRFAMIDNGLGFCLVPWPPSLERRLGQRVSGIAMPGAASIGTSGVSGDLGSDNRAPDQNVWLRGVGAEPRICTRHYPFVR